MTNIVDAFDAAARIRPDAIAIESTDGTLSYRDLQQAMVRVSSGLVDRGLRPGDRVMTLTENSVGAVVIYLALARSGIVNVPVNRMLTEPEVGAIADASEAAVFIYQPPWREIAESVTGERSGLIAVTVDEVLSNTTDGLLAAPARTTRDSPVSVIFSSGTLGVPKGCLKSHGNHLAAAINTQLTAPRGCEDVELFVIPVSGIGFANFVLPSLYVGARVIVERFDVERAWTALAERGVTTTFMAGTMLNALVEASGAYPRPRDLRILQTSYEISDVQRCAMVDVFGDSVFRYGYGSIEGGLTWSASDTFIAEPSCVGSPQAGLDRFAIVGEDGSAAPVGATGEIVVSGPTVMLRYLSADEVLPSDADGERIFATGDLGHVDTQGRLHFDGRLKDMIKTRGAQRHGTGGRSRHRGTPGRRAGRGRRSAGCSMGGAGRGRGGCAA